MRSIAVVGLLLVILLVSLSSYLRLDHSGIGCTPWPDCYGNIGAPATDQGIESAYERLVDEARQPLSWARPLHRLVASALGILVLSMFAIAIMRRRYRRVTSLLLALTVFLAWLGIYSQGLHSKAVVMGNLGGGFVMLAVFGWLVFKLGRSGQVSATDDALLPGRLVTVALLVTFAQVFLGGLTSANFAASACATLPSCFGQWLPGAELWSAFDLTGSLVINDGGFVVGGEERAAIHMLHRLFAVLTVAIVLTTSALVIRYDRRLLASALLVAGVVLAELTVGIAAVVSDVPISIAVAHNWLAGLLLLGLLYLQIKLPWRISHH